MGSVLDASQVERFEEQGFLLVPGLLDPKAELAALDVAYQDLIETLAFVHFAEAGARPPPDFRERPLGERFALMQGASGGHAVEHLDPVVSAFDETYRRRGDLPSAQIPQLFLLMRAGPLLGALESLIGPEIDASPIYHLIFKLAESHLALSRETAIQLGHPDPTAVPSGSTWEDHQHQDNHSPWTPTPRGRLIPMTEVGRGNLSVIPGSHRDRRRLPLRPKLRERRSI
jgi:hypothetical protein